MGTDRAQTFHVASDCFNERFSQAFCVSPHCADRPIGDGIRRRASGIPARDLLDRKDCMGVEGKLQGALGRYGVFRPEGPAVGQKQVQPRAPAQAPRNDQAMRGSLVRRRTFRRVQCGVRDIGKFEVPGELVSGKA